VLKVMMISPQLLFHLATEVLIYMNLNIGQASSQKTTRITVGKIKRELSL